MKTDTSFYRKKDLLQLTKNTIIQTAFNKATLTTYFKLCFCVSFTLKWILCQQKQHASAAEGHLLL